MLSGGGMTCEKRLVNGPKRVHRKQDLLLGWNGCHRYWAAVSDIVPVLKRVILPVA